LLIGLIMLVFGVALGLGMEPRASDGKAASLLAEPESDRGRMASAPSEAVLYRFGPSRNKAKWRWVSSGSALAAVLWLLASGLFSWYVAHFGSYNQTYRSLGAELIAEMERQTVKDTTNGAPKPLGARRAHAADTVAGSP
jgi:hypothetical protein